MENKLLYGDNLNVMAEMPDEFVDLIYLDPPFNSNRDYNAIFEIETGLKLPESVAAFEDTWEYNAESEKSFNDTILKMAATEIDNDDIECWKNYMMAMRKNNEKLLSYLIYMTERLLEMKRLLKPTGTIYLHCDPTASHYLKMTMDIIFSHKNFRNEIIWGYTGPSAAKKNFPAKHDTIFRYTKSDEWTFNPDSVRIPYKKLRTGKTSGIFKQDTTLNEKGKIPESWWTDISPVGRLKEERLNYPTQKPRKLLERIINASSNEGDLVLDPFCGCATTIDAAHRLKRKWIGIDITIFAINRISQKRLAKKPLGLTANVDYKIGGIPNSTESATTLWKKDAYQFQKWAIETIDGYVNPKRTGDGGVDGRLYFKKSDEELCSMVLEVKGGKNVNTDVVRKLIDALNTKGGEMAGLIHLEPLSAQMKKNITARMAKEGFVEIEGESYSKIQILSLEDMLQGIRFKTPKVQVDKKMKQREIFAQ